MKNKFLILRQILIWDKWGYDSLHRTLVFFTCHYSDHVNDVLIYGYKPKVWISNVSFLDFAKLFLNKKLRKNFTAEINTFFRKGENWEDLFY